MSEKKNPRGFLVCPRLGEADCVLAGVSTRECEACKSLVTLHPSSVEALRIYRDQGVLVICIQCAKKNAPRGPVELVTTPAQRREIAAATGLSAPAHQVVDMRELIEDYQRSKQ